MIKHILPLVNSIQHKVYVETFGGGGVVLFTKRPVALEVFNDINSGLYNFMYVLSKPKLFKRFQRRIEVLPYSWELYFDAWDTWKDETDKVERAVKWFIMIRQGFSGKLDRSWSFSVSGKSIATKNWMSAIDRLPEYAMRMRGVQVENRDWRIIHDRYDSPNTLFYLDPPYVHETRRSGGYDDEMNNKEHEDLIENLLTLQGNVVLSGYQHPIYKPLEDAGWVRQDHVILCKAAGGMKAAGLQGKGAIKAAGQTRVECLWIKPCKLGEGLFETNI